jgi:PKD repeat protein/spore germination protein YaaH
MLNQLIFKNIAILALFIYLIHSALYSQNTKSIVQEEAEYYKSLNISGDDYQTLNKPAVMTNKQTQACSLNKIVFGWHPYWSNGLEANYNWDLITDLSYFSYDVVASTGQASSTHSWATANVVTQALNMGKRVNLCVTLFSDHATFFGSSTAKQTLITNLINHVQSRGAHGVNIDFEGVPSSQKTNLTNFLIDLCTQMHTSIPGSQVSIALYAVDWNSVFDIPVLNNYIDLFVIMGYDYYYSGSTTAGPNDPLYHFYNDATTYNYTLSKTVTSYLFRGVSRSKLVLGLPYYGREYGTNASSIPSTVRNAPNSASRTFAVLKNNTSGNYSNANKQFVANSCNPVYVFHNGTEWRQCFFDDKYSMAKRFDFVNQRDIAGIGIWAMGYDDGYTDYWDNIRDKFSTCSYVPCTDTIYDMGGPNKNYYDNENYTYTIKPTGASGLTLTFTSFNLENNYDYLYIYDGEGTTNLIGQYTGTNSPGTITASGNALTIKFTSDGATQAPGFSAIWQCTSDNVKPTTQISAENWVNSNFIANFTDYDNNQVEKRFYQVLDYDGTQWRANKNHGLFNDNFENALHSEWTSSSGSWSINAGHLNQTQQVNSNTNIYAYIDQAASHEYLYHMQMKIDGTGTNRRAGFYIMCSDPTLDQRGEGYMIYYRVDNNKVQLYRVSGNTISIKTDDDCIVNAGEWYDIKVSYNPTTGELKAYQNDMLVSQWIDPSPVATGSAISLRTGDCDVMYDDIKVYKSRTVSEQVTIGSSSANVRYQNLSPSQPACRIKSVVIDANENWSSVAGIDVNVDWSAPSTVSVNDGLAADIDTVFDTNSLTANWTVSTDLNSGITDYWYAIGTSPGGANIYNWTSNGNVTNTTVNGLNLLSNTVYYFSVKSKNGAGLFSGISSSDGVVIPQTLEASFLLINNNFCINESVTFENNSIGANSFLWSFENTVPSSSTSHSPTVSFLSAGSHVVQLIASNGVSTDTASSIINIYAIPQANFSSDVTTGNIPLTVSFQNNSINSTHYFWSFENSISTNESNPIITYSEVGIYDVLLIACNNYCPCDTMLMPDYVDAYGTYLEALFSMPSGNICSNNEIEILNQSIGADSYLWLFEGATPASSNDVSPVVQYSQSGTFLVQLIAFNGQTSDTSSQLIIVNESPVANFVANNTQGVVPLTVTFSNSSQNAQSYIWSFGDGSNSPGTNPYHIYNSIGFYDVALVACNQNCPCDTLLMNDLVNVYVIDTNVYAGFSLSQNQYCTGDDVLVTNTSSGATNYVWEFEGANPTSSTDINPIVNYSNAGNFMVNLIAFNGQYSDTFTANILVKESPVASFSSSVTQGYVPLTVLYFNSSSFASQYQWNFGNGNYSSDSNPYTFYNDTGYYNVSLIACNNYCSCDTMIKEAYIHILDTIVGTASLITQTDFSMKPNPVFDFVEISGYFPDDNTLQIKIIDCLGRVEVRLGRTAMAMKNGKMVIDLHELVAGVYSIVLYFGSEIIYYDKIIKL